MQASERRKLLREEGSQHRIFTDPEEGRRARVSVRLTMGQYIPNDDVRRNLLGWIFTDTGGPLSTAALTDAQLAALKGWLKPRPNDGGFTTIDRGALDELRQMLVIVTSTEPGGLVRAAIEKGGVVTRLEKDDPRVPPRPKPFTFEP